MFYSKYVSCLALAFALHQADASFRQAVFDHSSVFSEAMRRLYRSLRPEEVVDKFKKCCVNRETLDPRIETEVDNIARNSVGLETLRVVSARVYPYVECADSLEALVKAISCDVQTGEGLVKKAQAVTSLCEVLGVRGQRVSYALTYIRSWLVGLKGSPVLFTGSYTSGSLLQVFSCTCDDDTRKMNHIMRRINKVWDTSVRDVILDFLPILKEGMFLLNLGADTKYEYDLNTHYAQILLSRTNPTINARCITGELLYDGMDGEEVPICYSLSEKSISAASGLHHEIFHHLVISLEMDEFPYFNRLVKALKKSGVDGSYLLKLRKIYTDMDEFRDIIGVFVDANGHLFFDLCSEAAYRCAERKCVRGTHKSRTGTIKYVPISFIEFLKDKIPNLKLKSSKKQESVDKLVWC